MRRPRRCPSRRGWRAIPTTSRPACSAGLTIARTGAPGQVEAVRLEPASQLSAVAVIPGRPVSTSASRGVLSAHVEHVAAARTASRAALLVAALTSRPDQLLAAAEDWLHQPYRLPARLATHSALVMMDTEQRERRLGGAAAVVAGAAGGGCGRGTAAA